MRRLATTITMLALALSVSCSASGERAAGPSPPPSPAATAAADRTDLADGRHAARVTDVDLSGRTVSVDVIQFLTGDEAAAAHEEDTGESGGPPNDYWIRNENARIRRLPLVDDVVVRLVELSAERPAEVVDATLEQLRTRTADTPDAPYWIRLRDGEVVEIEEQYVP